MSLHEYHAGSQPVIQYPEETRSRGRHVNEDDASFNFGFRGDFAENPQHLQTQSRFVRSESRPRYDSRRNSELYLDSPSSLGVYNAGGFDSRFNSESNLMQSPYPGSATGYSTPATHSRLGSEVNLLRHSDLRSSSPSTKSARVLGFEKSSQSLASIFSRNWAKDGSIIKLSHKDDIEHMPSWKRYLFKTTPLFVLLTVLSYWAYFAMRFYCIWSSQKQVGKVYPTAWVFITVEIMVVIPSHIFLIYFYLSMFVVRRKREKLRLTGDDVPLVDVFITCCKEETDLVMDTVRAACDVDYPADRFRVVVLDDGRDTLLEAQCDELRDTTFPNLYYRSREKIPGKPHHFKSGNLNYGFQEVAYLPGGAAPFAAALDADMIPERCWLRALLPHMLVDERMALACPPQLFYNTPPQDQLNQSLDFFVHVLEGLKDALGVAWCTGSGYVLRRDALEEIGWFPLGSLAEDVATSTLMLGKGWRTAFVHEPLQFGTVPDSYGSHLKQRTRWAIGTVDTAFKLKFCLWGEQIRQMTIAQRISGFIFAFLNIFNIFLAMSLFGIPIVLVTGHPLVAYANEEQLRLLIRFCFASLVFSRILDFLMSLPSGYLVSQSGARAQFWMSPYIGLSIFRSFMLPKWLGGQTQSFKPTGSLQSELNERDPTIRAGVFTRLRVMIFNYMAWYHILYVYFCLTAATLTTTRCIFEEYDSESRLRCLLTHAFWPPLMWLIIVSSFWVPVQYAISPPSTPPRDELLDRDAKTLVAHPKESSKKIAMGFQNYWYEVEWMVLTLFTGFIFVMAFIRL